MKEINNYIFEKLKINKDSKLENDKDPIQRIKKLLGIKNTGFYSEMSDKIEDWIESNNIKKILIHCEDNIYKKLSTESKKYIDKIESITEIDRLYKIYTKHGKSNILYEGTTYRIFKDRGYALIIYLIGIHNPIIIENDDIF